MPTPSPSSDNIFNSIFKAESSSDWIRVWGDIKATELIEDPVYEVDENASVESACEMLLAKNYSCLVVTSSTIKHSRQGNCVGLFDFADVNAFLTLAATQHTLSPDELAENPLLKAVLDAAKAGKVPVKLVSNLSGKNPLQTLHSSATLLDILEIFAQGRHRVVINSPAVSTVAPSGSPESRTKTPQGLLSDRQALTWFLKSIPRFTSPSLQPLLSMPLEALQITTNDVMFIPSDTILLEAMKIMSADGLSSLPIVDAISGRLISVVSVNDIGKIVVPAQDKAILTLSLAEFVKRIKGPAGVESGEDRFPIYAVGSGSTLLHTVQTLLATNAHRLLVTDDLSCSFAGMQQFGVVSIVDVLSHFARLACIEVDLKSMQRHRRASSASSSRSRSSTSLNRLSRPSA